MLLEFAAFSLLFIPAIASAVALLLNKPQAGNRLLGITMTALAVAEIYLLRCVVSSQSIILRTMGIQDSGLGLELHITALRLFFVVLSNWTLLFSGHYLLQQTASIWHRQLPLLLLLFFSLNGCLLSGNLINIVLYLESFSMLILALYYIGYPDPKIWRYFSWHLLSSLLLIVVVTLISFSFSNLYVVDLAPVLTNYMTYNRSLAYVLIGILILIMIIKFNMGWLLCFRLNRPMNTKFMRTIQLFVLPILASYFLWLFQLLINLPEAEVQNPNLGHCLILPLLLLLGWQLYAILQSRLQVAARRFEHFALAYQVLCFLGLSLNTDLTVYIARLLLVEYSIFAPIFFAVGTEGLSNFKRQLQQHPFSPHMIFAILLGINVLAIPFTPGFHLLLLTAEGLWSSQGPMELIFFAITLCYGLVKLLFGFKLLATLNDNHYHYSLTQLTFLGLGIILGYIILLQLSEIVLYYLQIM